MSDEPKSDLRLMIVAGEPSGDAHAAALVRALLEAAPEKRFEFFGATGAKMREAGVESVVRADELSILGLVEIGRALPRFWRAFKALKHAANKRQPQAVILVDWPDFNLRLARALHRRGLRIIYYISPQVWAWREYRVRSIKRNVDLLISILPFETDWYKHRGFDHVEYVGHPLAGAVNPRFGREEFCGRHHLDPSKPIVALLAGSRRKELERILPPMLDAAVLISRERPETQYVVALAPNRSSDELAPLLSGAETNLTIVRNETLEALASADAAAVASGTATLEAALIDTPFVIVYKESRINWHTLGRLIRSEHFGLINLIAGERLVPELMQNKFTGEALARELIALLDHDRNETERQRLKIAAARLGTGGASRRAARVVLTALDR